ncbi:cysteine proteinase [Hyaloscypha bicolor E]|uniref:ubiquitinyl hydrolase 1 n=1 Tax=Hyaloscypha bicolor E TaxID=1095630 RepID=A0A2J6T0E6_9HELO|nr:cysteine proteinase [Hyaloscypha bicolor E]PMD56484.1 cysteine proteinase [Hyaloscypha bicolor E]
MARTYLKHQSPQGFGKFSPSSSSDKAYARFQSKAHNTILKNPHRKSERPQPRNLPLPLRIKQIKMSTSASPSTKRTRPITDVGNHPIKHRRVSSAPVIGSFIRERPARCSSEPPTGLEGCGILEDVSSKCNPTPITKADKDHYLRRAKNFSHNWTNRRKRHLAKKVRSDWSGMPSSAQQGMKNLTGVLCYRHSLFQAILHCPQVAHWLRTYHSEESCIVDKQASCAACQLRTVIQTYWSGKSAELTKALENVNKVFKTNGWSQSGQADPDEQLTWLIGQMREQLPQQIYAYLDAFINFSLDSSTSCTKCGHVCTNFGETEGVLSVELLPRINGDLSKYLNKYFSYSVEGYKCDECKETSDNRRSRLISHSPDVVILQMMRFDPMGRKDKHPVPFSSTLDLNAYRTSTNKTNSTYSLAAVVQHSGGTGGGHYRCVARGKDQNWNIFDDARVIRGKESVALDPGSKGKSWTPYLLFFQRERK